LQIIESNLNVIKFTAFLPKLIQHFHLSELPFSISLASSNGNKNLIHARLMLDARKFSLSNAQLIASDYALLFGSVLVETAMQTSFTSIAEPNRKFDWTNIENSKSLFCFLFECLTEIIQNASWIVHFTEQLNFHQVSSLMSVFHSMSTVLHTLASSAISLAFATSLFTTARIFYQALSTLFKLMHELEFFESTLVPSLVTEAMYRLAKAIYTLIPWMQSVEVEAEAEQHLAKKKKTTGSASNRNSFSRSLPDLIYQMEMCERILVDYSKVCSVNLHRLVAKATSRDFKIREDEMQLELEQTANQQITEPMEPELNEQPVSEAIDDDPTLLMQDSIDNAQ
jgi:hypothetical protein